MQFLVNRESWVVRDSTDFDWAGWNLLELGRSSPDIVIERRNGQTFGGCPKLEPPVKILVGRIEVTRTAASRSEANKNWQPQLRFVAFEKMFSPLMNNCKISGVKICHFEVFSIMNVTKFQILRNMSQHTEQIDLFRKQFKSCWGKLIDGNNTILHYRVAHNSRVQI